MEQGTGMGGRPGHLGPLGGEGAGTGHLASPPLPFRIRPLPPESGAFPFTAAAGVPALELGFDEVGRPRVCVTSLPMLSPPPCPHH